MDDITKLKRGKIMTGFFKRKGVSQVDAVFINEQTFREKQIKEILKGVVAEPPTKTKDTVGYLRGKKIGQIDVILIETQMFGIKQIEELLKDVKIEPIKKANKGKKNAY